MTQPTLIAPEVIACIAEGRDPSVAELNRVAEHIRADLSIARPALAMNARASESERLLILRAAQAALTGDPMGELPR
ncbi:hypothetical protein FPZ54_03620 [Sphingomonas suaedae]|uniref:Uncharacterized protein n=1 Tax=Sphingomonas suaedae TaxID=2599297 RepID=A0A518RCM6_9SPHN|nr:hypothetical protein [Sphingomonas suaedae]QDX25202.1 hypothetical protein FPZ54_03620 [Sphingomonas suaedae]